MHSAVLAAVASIAPLSASAEDRSIDGSGNNLTNTSWGQAGTIYLREASGAHYANGISTPNGASRPDARTISNSLMTQSDDASVLDPRNLTAMVYSWGQFIDHDLDARSNASPNESFNINVPAGDLSFDPFNTGTAIIPMSRSSWDPTTGTSAANPRQQINNITSFLDASMVYGSNATRAAWLRTGSAGQLKSVATPSGALLPSDDGTQSIDGLTGPSTSSSLFVAGDSRANEQAGITSLQTLLVREHNRQATLLARLHPGWTDEQIYQHARAIVSGEVESITYNQFLPAMLGNSAMPAYTGYNALVNPSAGNAFAAVGFRVGHSMLDDDIERVGPDGNTIAAGNLPLRNAFFNPGVIQANGGIDPILRGVTTRIEQAVDPLMVDDIRNFLFGPPGAGGMDLAALDIQRARDHGLADYNTMRQDFGLAKVTTFAQITADPTLQAKLQQLYGNVNNIDAFVGCLVEDHLSGSSVGPLTSAIIVDQFKRTRDGDRFFYQNDANLSGSEISSINNFTLADLIRRNTFVRNIQDNVFVAGAANFGPTWNIATGGSWQTPGNWAGGTPNAAGAFATFQTSPGVSSNVTLDGPTVLGSLQLVNPNGITVSSGAGGSITFDNLGSNAAIIVTAGAHAISAPMALTDSMTIRYEGTGQITLSGNISENYAGRSLTIDGGPIGPTGGGVTSLSGSNSFSGGVSVTQSLVNLNHANAQGVLGSVASATDNGEISLGFTPTASHRFAINDLGAITGDNTQLGALSVGGNLTLASGAMIVRQTAGGTLPGGLTNSGNLYSAYTTTVTGATAAITIGSTSGTPFRGIGSDRLHSYTWGNSGDVLTLSGNADLVALGNSALTVGAKLTGGANSDTLTKRGTGLVRLTNAANNFAASNIVIEGGNLQFAYGTNENFAANVNFNVGSLGDLSFNDGFSATINGAVTNNGAIVKPAGTSTQLIFKGGVLTGNGLLLAQDAQVTNSGTPNFTQTATSTVLAHAILFDNGKTNTIGGITGVDSDNSAPIIAINGPSTSAHLTGRWDGDGTNVNSWLIVNNGGKFIFDAGSALDTIGTTAGGGTFLRSMNGRGDGTGTVIFADGFTAGAGHNGADEISFYSWSPGNFTWVTNNQENFPEATIEINAEDGGTWAVQTHDQVCDSFVNASKNFTIDTTTNLTLNNRFALHMLPDRNGNPRTLTKAGPGTLTIAGEHSFPGQNNSATLSTAGSTMIINGGNYVTLTDMGQASSSAGPDGVFGPPGLPGDDTVLTAYVWNVAVNNPGSGAYFDASQHLLSLKVNSGGVANQNDFTYGGNTHTTLTAKTLGTDAGSGTLNISAGNTAIASTAFSIASGATFNKSGAGSLNITGSTTFGPGAAMNVTNGTASFNLPAGATSTVGNGNQTLSVSSGAILNITATNRDPLSDQTTSSQRVNLNNDGIFNLLASSVKAGAIDGAGTTVLSSTTSLRANHIRQSMLNIGTGASATIEPNGGNAGTSKVSTLSLAGGAAPTAKIDLKDNDLIIDYPAGGPDPIATVASQIKSARASGTWTGNGITSTMADASLHALGYIDNITNPKSSFSGLPIDPSSIIVKYTYYGDANLDGQVDMSDLFALSAHWGSSGDVWATGDFDYDGSVTVADLYLLAKNWQMGVGSPLGPILASLGLPNVNVPEPAGFGLVTMAACLLKRRRK